jgi:cytochrome c oxidase assembly factor CtaG
VGGIRTARFTRPGSGWIIGRIDPSESGFATPSVVTFLTTWSFDPVAFVALVAAGVLYALGLAALARRGHRWRLRHTLGFYLLGLGSYAWVSFGFLGTYSPELRWAFTTRFALLLFAVPSLIVLGRPVALARVALRGRPKQTLERFLKSWPVRIFGNAIFAPIFALVLFMFFLTPLAAIMREDPIARTAITVLVPLIGLFMVLPIASHNVLRTSLFITAEFMLAFVELMLDAIPGILLRLNGTVLDHAARITTAVPPWFPTPLRDQQLSGDLLWFIAEVSDIPVLIVLFVRWSRTDRSEAKKVDELSDEEMDELMRAHLRGPHSQDATPR